MSPSLAGITIATGRTDGTASWRVPLGIQIAPAVILATMSFVLPEVRDGAGFLRQLL